LDLQKAFDCIDHAILLSKLSSFGLNGVSKLWFQNYISDRYQQVCINGELSPQLPINIGVPQGSILGPLLFLLYINDLPTCLSYCKAHLYADDTVLYLSSANPSQAQSYLSHDLNNICNWLTLNKLTLNTKKTQFIVFGTPALLKKFNGLRFSVNDQMLERVASIKYLGVVLDEHLKWDNQIKTVLVKARSRLYLLSRLRPYVSSPIFKILYMSLLQSVFDYGDILWSEAAECKLDALQKIQNRAIKILFNQPKHTAHICSVSELLNSEKLDSLKTRRKKRLALFAYQVVNNECLPVYLNNLVERNRRRKSPRLNNGLITPRTTNSISDNALSVQIPKLWSLLPNNLTSISSFTHFKKSINSITFQ